MYHHQSIYLFICLNLTYILLLRSGVLRTYVQFTHYIIRIRGGTYGIAPVYIFTIEQKDVMRE